MNILNRYLIKQSTFLLLVILLVSTGVYLLGDVFERIDTFLESNIGFGASLIYFMVKLPNVISQLLPAVFLIALVIQLNILARTNELVALQAGGISPFAILRFILVFGLFWTLMQLFFSQIVGVEGERYANDVWREQVKGYSKKAEEVSGLWFTEKGMIIHIEHAQPKEGMGRNILLYELSADGLSLTRTIQANSFQIFAKHWELRDGFISHPDVFSRKAFTTYELPIRQNLKAFVVAETARRPANLPLWELGTVIKQLKHAGSNVEAFRVAWHNKLAYAVSIFVMGIFALAISQLTTNIYKAIGYALLTVFLFYGANRIFSTLGEQGRLNPVVGAWFADVAAFTFGIFWLLLPVIRQKNK